MKIIGLLTIILIFFCINANAAFIASDHPLLKFCDNYSKTANIVGAYNRITPSYQPTPTFPFIIVSVVPGLVSNKSTIVEMCDMLTRLEALNTKDGIFYAARFLDDMTDNKWATHLDFMDSAFSLHDTLFDPETGKMRPGVLKSAATHREINDFAQHAYKLYNKTVNGNDAEMKTRAERQADIDQLAQISYKSATLKSAVACPNPPENKDYQKIYQTQILPREQVRDSTNDDIDFFKERLYTMGSKFINKENKLMQYFKDIDSVIKYYAIITPTPNVQNKTSYYPSPKKKDSNGKPIMETRTIKVTTYEYKVIVDSTKLNDIQERYQNDWSTWVKAQYLSMGTRGLLNDPTAKIEDDFKDLNYECQPSRIMLGYDRNDPKYDRILEENRAKCLKDTKVDQTKEKNLFSYYMRSLGTSLDKNKRATAYLWTQDSLYLNINRNIVNNPSSGQDEVVCSDSQKMDSTVMASATVKEKQLNNDLKALMAKQMAEKTTLMQTKEQSRSDSQNELLRKAEMSEKRLKNDEKINKGNHAISVIPFDSTIKEPK